MLSAVKPTIIMLILGKINQISVCLAVALRLKLIWKKIVINHLVNSPFKVEVVSVLHPEVQVTKKKTQLEKTKQNNETKKQKPKTRTHLSKLENYPYDVILTQTIYLLPVCFDS